MFELNDYLAIQELVHSYPRHLDSGDLVGLGHLFDHAAVHFENLQEPIVKDPAAITKMFADFLQLYDGIPRTRHLIMNLIVKPESPTRAHATSTVLVVQSTPEFPLQPIITGDYRDIFDKVNDSWRFSERFITNDLYGDLSAHGRYSIS